MNKISTKKGGNNILFLNRQDINDHLLLVGNSGEGKSKFPFFLAEKLGIDTDEVNKMLIQSKEHCDNNCVELKKNKTQKIEKKIKKRELKVKKSVWKSIEKGYFEIPVGIHSNKELTKKELKELFLTLPMNIIGGIVSWGISDTVVRDDIYSFFEG